MSWFQYNDAEMERSAENRLRSVAWLWTHCISITNSLWTSADHNKADFKVSTNQKHIEFEYVETKSKISCESSRDDILKKLRKYSIFAIYRDSCSWLHWMARADSSGDILQKLSIYAIFLIYRRVVMCSRFPIWFCMRSKWLIDAAEFDNWNFEKFSN